MVYHGCAVPGCMDKLSPRHRFPNPVKDGARFLRWIELVGHPNLSNVDPQKVFNNYRVCHQHFSDDCIITNNKLLKTTLPSLHLPRSGKYFQIGITLKIDIKVLTYTLYRTNSPTTTKALRWFEGLSE